MAALEDMLDRLGVRWLLLPSIPETLGAGANSSGDSCMSMRMSMRMCMRGKQREEVEHASALAASALVTGFLSGDGGRDVDQPL